MKGRGEGGGRGGGRIKERRSEDRGWWRRGGEREDDGEMPVLLKRVSSVCARAIINFDERRCERWNTVAKCVNHGTIMPDVNPLARDVGAFTSRALKRRKRRGRTFSEGLKFELRDGRGWNFAAPCYVRFNLSRLNGGIDFYSHSQNLELYSSANTYHIFIQTIRTKKSFYTQISSFK